MRDVRMTTVFGYFYDKPAYLPTGQAGRTGRRNNEKEKFVMRPDKLGLSFFI